MLFCSTQVPIFASTLVPLTMLPQQQFCWTVQKNQPYLFQRKIVYVWNTAVGSACWLIVTVSLASFMWHVFDAVRLCKSW